MTRPVSLLLLAITAVSVTAAAPAPETYAIDKAHTQIGFAVRHLMVSTVRGTFREFDGAIHFDEADITRSSARFTVNAASIDTGNERRDNHLRSDDFFNAEAFPTIQFTSRRVVRQGQQLSLVGDLTIRDVTKEVVIPFELAGPLKSSNGRKRIGAEGTLTINRFDYGLKYNRMTEAVAVVADEVRIEINVEATTAAP